MKKFYLIPLWFLAGLGSSPVFAEAEHTHHQHPDTVEYALILPANLPHILRIANDQAGKLGLNEEKKQLLRTLMAEAPLKVFSHLQQAEKLERSIAEHVLYGHLSLTELHPHLDALERLKREATEAQISTIHRIRDALSHAQFKNLMEQVSAGKSY